jgi:hypothetical protein
VIETKVILEFRGEEERHESYRKKKIGAERFSPDSVYLVERKC